MRSPLILLLVAGVLLGGCASPSERTAGSEPAPGESVGELRKQAQDRLDRYGTPPPSWDAADPPAGTSIESATGSPASPRLTVGFTGTKDPATKPCGADYHAEAVESARAVVVIVVEQRHGDSEICTLIGFPRTATLTLAAPLGTRAVLEVRQGTPVPVTTTS